MLRPGPGKQWIYLPRPYALLSQFRWQSSFLFFYSFSTNLIFHPPPHQSDHLPSISVSLSFHSLLTNQSFSPFLSNQSNPLSPILVPRPRPLMREKRVWWPSADSSGFIKLIAFPGGIRQQPITLQKTQSVVVAPEILDYFNTMTQHFYGA